MGYAKDDKKQIPDHAEQRNRLEMDDQSATYKQFGIYLQ